MKNPPTPEQRAARIKFWTQTGIFVVLGLVAAPIVATAIYGLAGIIAAALIGTVAIAAGPVVAQKVANLKLKAMKAEARKNPVETLQLEYRRRQELLEEKKGSIELFCGSIRTFESKMAGFSKRYPAEAPRFQEQLSQMIQLGQLRKDNYRRALVELAAFNDEIEKAGAIWEMGQCAAATAEGAGMSEDDFYAKLKVETSLDAIQLSMNTAFAQLDVCLLDEQVRQDDHTSKLLQEATRDAQPVAFRQTLKA